MIEDRNQNSPLDPEHFLQYLIAGNRRYSLGVGVHPHQTLSRRDELVSTQHPGAVVVGCSDSRVPPEIIFDCGLGDLAVIRLAGQVVDDAALATVQFAVEYLGVKLIIVLGHSDCAAVKLAMELQAAEVAGVLGGLLAKITPAVAKAVADHGGDMVENVVIENIKLNIARLKEAGWAKPLMIRGAYYNLKSGLVTLDPDH
jgi:carbonic anhydrase